MQTRTSTSIALGAALLLPLVTGCCKTNCPKTIEPIATPAGWVEVSKQTPKGATVSLAVPEGWENVPAERPLIARRATTSTNGFYAIVSVVVDPFTGTLDAYVDANTHALGDQAEITSERRVRLGDRDAYELGYRWPGPPQSSILQLIEVVDEEAISVTCAASRGDSDALQELCNKIFGSYSVTALSP